MNRFKRHILRHKRSCWLVAALVCLMQILPWHLHVHHVSAADPDHLAHTANLYLATHHDDQAHHQDAHVIDLDSSSMVKTPDGDALVPLLGLCPLALILISPVQRWRPAVTLASAVPRPFYLAFAPPRAPPHV